MALLHRADATQRGVPLLRWHTDICGARGPLPHRCSFVAAFVSSNLWEVSLGASCCLASLAGFSGITTVWSQQDAGMDINHSS
jgi:hypothetical protein